MTRPGVSVKIDDRGWRALTAKVYGLDKAHVKVGVLASKGGSMPHTSTTSGEAPIKGGEGKITLIELAAIHEFGSPAAGIPERSFIRRTFETQKAALEEIIGKLARLVVTKGMAPRKALGILGAWAVAEINKTVKEGEGVPPPLQQRTIDRKGSTRPLIDTGRLLQAVTYEVSDGEDE